MKQKTQKKEVIIPRQVFILFLHSSRSILVFYFLHENNIPLLAAPSFFDFLEDEAAHIEILHIWRVALDDFSLLCSEGRANSEEAESESLFRLGVRLIV